MDSAEIDQAAADYQECQAYMEWERNQMLAEVFLVNHYSADLVKVMTVDEAEARSIQSSGESPIEKYGYEGVKRIQQVMKRYYEKDAAGKAEFFLDSIKFVSKLLMRNKELVDDVEDLAELATHRKLALVSMRKDREKLKRKCSRMAVERAKAITMTDAVVKELVGVDPLKKGKSSSGIGKKKACRRLQFTSGSASSSSSSTGI